MTKDTRPPVFLEIFSDFPHRAWWTRRFHGLISPRRSGFTPAMFDGIAA